MKDDYEVRSKYDWKERGVIEEEIEHGSQGDIFKEFLDTIDIMEQRIARLESMNIRQMLKDAGHKPRGE